MASATKVIATEPLLVSNSKFEFEFESKVIATVNGLSARLGASDAAIYI